jgi:hypothetical protein
MRWQVDIYVDVRIEEMGLSDFFPATTANVRSVAGRIKHITMAYNPIVKTCGFNCLLHTNSSKTSYLQLV